MTTLACCCSMAARGADPGEAHHLEGPGQLTAPLRLARLCPDADTAPAAATGAAPAPAAHPWTRPLACRLSPPRLLVPPVWLLPQWPLCPQLATPRSAVPCWRRPAPRLGLAAPGQGTAAPTYQQCRAPRAVCGAAGRAAAAARSRALARPRAPDGCRSTRHAAALRSLSDAAPAEPQSRRAVGARQEHGRSSPNSQRATPQPLVHELVEGTVACSRTHPPTPCSPQRCRSQVAYLRSRWYKHGLQ